MRHIELRDLDVSRIGLGAMGMSHGYPDSGTDEEESIRTLHRALELGMTDRESDSDRPSVPPPLRHRPATATATTAAAFALTDDQMAAIATLETGTSLFFDHRDPKMVTWLAKRRPTD
jgi:diketogulonate reductase-like aldo/keto reductase